jgi:hypothetical protein
MGARPTGFSEILYIVAECISISFTSEICHCRERPLLRKDLFGVKTSELAHEDITNPPASTKLVLLLSHILLLLIHRTGTVLDFDA